MTMPGYRQPEFSLTTTFVPRTAAEPGRLHGGQQQPASAVTARSGSSSCRRPPRSGGPQQVQGNFESQHGRVQGALPVPPGRLDRDHGQPDHDAAGRRPALHRARLRHRPRPGATGSYPTAETGVRLLRRPRSGFQPSLPGALAQVFTGLPTPARARPAARRAAGQRARPQVPEAGAAVLRAGAGRPAQRRPHRLRPGHRQDGAAITNAQQADAKAGIGDAVA